MNANHTKWVMASVINKFKTGLNSAPNYLWVIGEKLDTSRGQRFELRYLGPTFSFVSANEVICRVSLNMTVRSDIAEQYPFNAFDRIGLAQSMFTNCIKIYKFGSIPGVDTREQFDVLRLNSEINTVNYGQIDLVDSVVVSTIEADYIGEFRI